MSGHRVIAVGEVLWDLLPRRRALGGAPCNVALHAKSLGADAALITRVATDELGDAIIDVMRSRGLDDHTIQRDEHAPTSTVGVELDPQGHALYTIQPDVAWDHLVADAEALTAARSADAVCFGSLAQRTPTAREAVQEIVAAAPPEALRMFDANLRPPFVDPEILRSSLAIANACKINSDELPTIAGLYDIDPSADPMWQVRVLADHLSLKLFVLTRGAAGSLLYADGRFSDLPGRPIEVRDTVGAGDSFTAAAIVGWLAGWPLEVVNQRAADVAAYVCTQPGATPELPEALRRPFLDIAWELASASLGPTP